MKKLTIIAIDPGKLGGIAFQYPDENVNCFPMPETEGDILTQLRSIAAAAPSEVVCYIEEMVRHIAGRAQPGSHAIVYGRNWGFLAGVVQTLCIRMVIVSPKGWQKKLGLGTAKGLTKTAWKNKLKQHAQQLFPLAEGNITLKTADALLLLEYGRREGV